MNLFNGHITRIDTEGSLSVVEITVSAQVIIRSIIIETPQTAGYLTLNRPVRVLFKETAVIISKQNIIPDISLENSIAGTISGIEKGGLLSNIRIHTPAGEIMATVNAGKAKKMNWHTGDNVWVLINANEIMLSE